MSVRNLVTLVYLFAGEIRNGRTPEDVLRHANSEMDELREEIVKINQGETEGDDGVLGETIDIIACVVDLLHEVGISLDDAIGMIDTCIDSTNHRRFTLSQHAEHIERDLSVLSKSSSVMIGSDAACTVRDLLLLIEDHYPKIKMPDIEVIALKKCEKWKLHYSKSVERVR